MFILQATSDGVEQVLDAGAIQLCARKVAAVAGEQKQKVRPGLPGEWRDLVRRRYLQPINGQGTARLPVGAASQLISGSNQIVSEPRRLSASL